MSSSSKAADAKKKAERQRSRNKVQRARPAKGAGAFQDVDSMKLVCRLEDGELAGTSPCEQRYVDDPQVYWQAQLAYGELLTTFAREQLSALPEDKAERMEALKQQRSAARAKAQTAKAVQSPEVQAAYLSKLAAGELTLDADSAAALLAQLQAQLAAATGDGN